MIFITVGMTRFPLIRMERIFRDVCRTRKNNELVVFQHGVTPVATVKNNAVLVPYIAFNTTNQYLHQARVVICHGGPATIYQAILAAKSPYVLPRKKALGEHVDDHQVFFSAFIEKRGAIRVIADTGNRFFSNSRKVPLSRRVDQRLTRYLISLMNT